jgi:hypothetical protein
MMTSVAALYFNCVISMDRLSTQDENSSEYTSWRVRILHKIDVTKDINSNGDNVVDRATSKSTPLNSSDMEALASTMKCPYLHTKSLTTSSSTNVPSHVENNISPSAVNHKDLSIGLSAKQLNQLFPFHIIFNRQLQIVQCGSKLDEFIPISKGVSTIDHLFFIASSPYSWEWDVLLKVSGNMEFMIRSIDCSMRSSTCLSLSGNLVFSDDSELCYFCCVPNVRSLSDMVEQNLNMSHLSGQTSRLELVLQSENLVHETTETHKLKEITNDLEAEKQHTKELMNEVIHTTTEAMAAKKTFIRYVSREIRSPLTVVSLGLSVLEGEIKKLGQTYQSAVDNILQCKSSVDCAVTILEDLLSYEKLESGILELNKKHAKAKSFIESSIMGCQEEVLRLLLLIFFII